MAEDFNIIHNTLFLEKGSSRHISIFVSGSEHIGSSWCALSLAHALNIEKKRVLLVDGNGNFSNISSYILLNNPLYLEEYFKGNNTLNQLLTAYKNKDFNILTANPGNNFLADASIGRIHVFTDDLGFLASNYDHTIIDVGEDLTEKNLEFYQLADTIFILCSEKNSDLVKTLDIIRHIHEIGLSANCNLIINRVNSFEDGYKIYKELYKALERNNLAVPNLIGMVRFDTRIRDTIKNRELLLSRYPASEAAIDICNIAKKFCLENSNE